MKTAKIQLIKLWHKLQLWRKLQTENMQTGQWLFLLLPMCLLIVYFSLNPLAYTLVSNTVSTAKLNAQQQANIILAAKAVDGYVLAPGKTFSFNKVIGPRTDKQGYTKSRSYLETETPMTFGGGICLLSSVLYKDAIELGLVINERTAHTRTTQCIPAGFDATVWYGQNDLKFTNNQKTALKINAIADRQDLTVSILGSNKPPTDIGNKLQRIVRQADKHTIDVVVLRKTGNQISLVSRDSYRINQACANMQQ